MSWREMFAPVALAGIRLSRRLIRPPRGAFRILLFHDILEAQDMAFAALIAQIRRTDGFITPLEAAARLEGTAGATQDNRLPCLVSFDDGFASNRRIADSVLRQNDVRALFFICPGIIDLPPTERPAAVARGIFDGRLTGDAEAARRPMMNWTDVRELATSGHEIGAHSMSHRRLTGLDAAILQKEVGDSCRRLAEVLGRRPDWFAWPFGDIDSIDAEALTVIGRQVRLCRSGVRGLNRPGQHRLAVFADHVDLTRSLHWQELTIAGGLDQRYRAARAALVRLSQATGQQPLSP